MSPITFSFSDCEFILNFYTESSDILSSNITRNFRKVLYFVVIILFMNFVDKSPFIKLFVPVSITSNSNCKEMVFTILH